MTNIILNALGLGTCDTGFMDTLTEDFDTELSVSDVEEAIGTFSDVPGEIGNALIYKMYERAIDNALDDAGIDDDEERYQIEIHFHIDANASASMLHLNFPNGSWEQITDQAGLVTAIRAYRIAREAA